MYNGTPDGGVPSAVGAYKTAVGPTVDFMICGGAQKQTVTICRVRRNKKQCFCCPAK